MPRPASAQRLPARRPRRATAVRALATAATLAVLPAPTRAQPFTSLTFFGDSYVDTGNAFALTGGAQAGPPYALRRFSNGLVFTDYMAQALGIPGDATAVFTAPFVPPNFPPLPASGNYAIGGARAAGNLQSTQTQITAYLTRQGVTPATRTDPTGLYTLFVGGNDLRDISAVADPAAREAAALAAAQNVIAQAGALAGAGAGNVLLFTLQSTGVLPEAVGDPAQVAIRDQIAATFNTALAAGVLNLQAAAPGTTFLNFRLDNLFANLLLDARTGGQLYGLTNLTTPCLPGFAPPSGPSCDVSVFADAIHPTTRTHEIIGTAVARYVTTGQNVAVIPEPSTLALLAGGAGVLVAVRRRRAA